jgi:molybdopterin-guanine dinucleotide biosynthesis protein A
MNTAIAILAGGQSQRMGEDKALLRIGEENLLQRTARLALMFSPHVLVAGRARPNAWPTEWSNVQFVPDDVPHQGPLIGIQSTLNALPTGCDKVLLLACDLPLLSEEALQWLFGQAQSTLKHGLIVDNSGQWEPLFSIYTREIAPLIATQMVQPRRSLHALIKAGEFAFVELPTSFTASLTNVNTPEEWQQCR